MQTPEQKVRSEVKLLSRFHLKELRKDWPHAQIWYHEGWPYIHLGNYLSTGKELEETFYYDRERDIFVVWPPVSGVFAQFMVQEKLSPIAQAVARNTTRLRKYGLSQEDYEQMFRDQNGLCYICRKPPKKHFCVDHDHKKTGRKSVRGLLCPWCNYMLGFFKDDPEKFDRAAQYLRRPNPFA